jgi:hypothetical protein
LRKISREAGARQCGGSLKFSVLFIDFYGMLGRGAQKKSKGYFSLTQSSQHERGRLPGLIQPLVDQMRRGSVHVNASRKTFKNIYAMFHTFHRMGASQERAAFFKGCDATSRRATRPTENSPCPPALRAFLHLTRQTWRC